VATQNEHEIRSTTFDNRSRSVQQQDPQREHKLETCQFEELAHTAEVGLLVHSNSAEGLFACAAKAMFVLLDAAPAQEEAPVTHHVTIDSVDAESLLVDWLSELLYLYETTGKLFTECEVTMWTPTHLEAEVHGRAPSRTPRFDIKAITYHDLELGQDERGWFAQVFFDI
jgi:SHS2 domain-containing protein